MTSDLDISTGDRRRSRAYAHDFWPGMAGYLVLLSAAVIWGDLDGDSPWRYAWAVLPALPAALAVRAVVRHVRRIDDYQRLLLLQGLAAGFAVAMVTALTLGLLGAAGLETGAAGWIVYGAGMLGWGIASVVAGRR